MNYFALFHITASLIYVILGFYILRRDRYAALNIVYSLLCALFALWAFAFAFMHISTDLTEAYFIYNLSAPGWCLFSGLSLHVMLLIAGKNELLKKWWLYPLMYIPGVSFTVLQWAGVLKLFKLVRFGPGFLEVPITDSIWYWLYIAYQVIFIFYGLYMLVTWGLSASYRREKKQAFVLVASISLTYVLCFITDIIFPLLEIFVTPPLSVIFILIFSLGTLIAIVRYQMFSISLLYASDEIMKQIREAVILLKLSGQVLNANAWTGTLLRCGESGIIGKDFSGFLEDRRLFNKQMAQMIINKGTEFFIETSLLPLNGERIPCGITGTAIRDRVGDIIATLIICIDLTEKRKLQREIGERIKTADALRLREEQIRARNDEIEQQLIKAQLVQKALLPDTVPVSERILIDYRFYTMDAVGGDYFSFVNASEGLGIFIGDVSGHGVSAALFLSLLKNESDRIAGENHTWPVRFMDALNKSLIRSMPHNYMTAIYGFFSWDDRNKGALFTWTSGGHPYPALNRQGEASACYLKTGDPVLAIFDNAQYHESEISLNYGDRIFLFTDGLPESRNSRGEMLGYENILELIQSSMKHTLPEALDFIVREVSAFRGSCRVDDDMLIIGCEVI